MANLDLILSETTDTKGSSIMHEPSTIQFCIDDEVVIELRENGKILIRGEEAENDKKVVAAMREFLKHSGFLGYDNG